MNTVNPKSIAHLLFCNEEKMHRERIQSDEAETLLDNIHAYGKRSNCEIPDAD